MDTTAASVNKTALNPSKYLSANMWITLTVVLFVAIFFVVSNRIYNSQPAKVVVNTKNLDAAQYETLNKVMEKKEAGSFFTAILPELKDSAMQQDWISQVDIERKWGEGIVITALPREAIARFGSEHLIDSQSKVYKPVSESELLQPGLIMLQGDADQSTLIMQQMQQVNQWFAPLEMQVEDLVLTPRMTWAIKFNNGMRIIVDNEHTSQKLMNLSQLLQNQLADKKENIAAADLRYKNGFVIDWKAKVEETTSTASVVEDKKSQPDRTVEQPSETAEQEASAEESEIPL
ncbi:cell division protein FtsQ/DivIB [Psychrobacter sp. UBA3962]|uniref:cell division protein FtsQ/DivIB n=1 Tax=Psychrobacter sp. UBA3962 TaxID=1947352 RepID=UPI0025F7A144|nr:cell division protein FtsQ/DivIB [Psychrobacter sp. UBA3962]